MPTAAVSETAPSVRAAYETVWAGVVVTPVISRSVPSNSAPSPVTSTTLPSTKFVALANVNVAVAPSLDFLVVESVDVAGPIVVTVGASGTV